MVGRLVEQQQVGLSEQDRRQRHPHPPAAGQFVERLALHRVIEAEPGEDARRPARRRIGVDLDEPRFDLGGAQRRRPGFALGQQAGALAIGGEHRIVRGCGAARRLLSEKSDAAAARQLDRAVLGLQHPADQIEQGRFADAVAADQPDLGAFGDLRVRPVEQRPMAVDAVGYLEQGQHGGLIASRPRSRDMAGHRRASWRPWTQYNRYGWGNACSGSCVAVQIMPPTDDVAPTPMPIIRRSIPHTPGARRRPKQRARADRRTAGTGPGSPRRPASPDRSNNSC